MHQGSQGWGAISSSHWARGEVHPEQVTIPSQGNTERDWTNNHLHTYAHTLTHRHKSLLLPILGLTIDFHCF